jgi:hypothetical protein
MYSFNAEVKGEKVKINAYPARHIIILDCPEKGKRKALNKNNYLVEKANFIESLGEENDNSSSSVGSAVDTGRPKKSRRKRKVEKPSGEGDFDGLHTSPRGENEAEGLDPGISDSAFLG